MDEKCGRHARRYVCTLRAGNRRSDYEPDVCDQQRNGDIDDGNVAQVRGVVPADFIPDDPLDDDAYDQ